MAEWTAVRIKPVVETPIPGLAARKDFTIGRPGRLAEIWYVTNAGGLDAGLAPLITAAVLKSVRHVQVLDASGVQITAVIPSTTTITQPPSVAAPTVAFTPANLGAGTAGFVILYGNH